MGWMRPSAPIRGGSAARRPPCARRAGGARLEVRAVGHHADAGRGSEHVGDGEGLGVAGGVKDRRALERRREEAQPRALLARGGDRQRGGLERAPGREHHRLAGQLEGGEGDHRRRGEQRHHVRHVVVTRRAVRLPGEGRRQVGGRPAAEVAHRDALPDLPAGAHPEPVRAVGVGGQHAHVGAATGQLRDEPLDAADQPPVPVRGRERRRREEDAEPCRAAVAQRFRFQRRRLLAHAHPIDPSPGADHRGIDLTTNAGAAARNDRGSLGIPGADPRRRLARPHPGEFAVPPIGPPAAPPPGRGRSRRFPRSASDRGDRPARGGGDRVGAGARRVAVADPGGGVGPGVRRAGVRAPPAGPRREGARPPDAGGRLRGPRGVHPAPGRAAARPLARGRGADRGRHLGALPAPVRRARPALGLALARPRRVDGRGAQVDDVRRGLRDGGGGLVSPRRRAGRRHRLRVGGGARPRHAGARSRRSDQGLRDLPAELPGGGLARRAPPQRQQPRRLPQPGSALGPRAHARRAAPRAALAPRHRGGARPRPRGDHRVPGRRVLAPAGRGGADDPACAAGEAGSRSPVAWRWP